MCSNSFNENMFYTCMCVKVKETFFTCLEFGIGQWSEIRFRERGSDKWQW